MKPFDPGARNMLLTITTEQKFLKPAVEELAVLVESLGPAADSSVEVAGHFRKTKVYWSSKRRMWAYLAKEKRASGLYILGFGLRKPEAGRPLKASLTVTLPKPGGRLTTSGAIVTDPLARCYLVLLRYVGTKNKSVKFDRFARDEKTLVIDGIKVSEVLMCGGVGDAQLFSKVSSLMRKVDKMLVAS